MKNIFKHKPAREVNHIKAVLLISNYKFIATNIKQRRLLKITNVTPKGITLHYGDSYYYTFAWKNFNKAHELITENGDVLSDVIGFDSVTSQLFTSKGKKYLCLKKDAELQTHLIF